MSFKPDDNNLTIHQGNYEEFFLLYIDHELNAAQMKMVEDFVSQNPELQAELELLISTKLPSESFSFDKEGLLAENMKLSSVDEELLLFIDDELPAERKAVVELELASNKDYQEQHQSLLQTKLDPAEKIVYPFKKELYRNTERTIALRIWIRVAAAVVLIAAASIFYFTRFQNDQRRPVAMTPQEKTTAPLLDAPARSLAKAPVQNKVAAPTDHPEQYVAATRLKKAQRKNTKAPAPSIQTPEKRDDIALVNTIEEAGLKQRVNIAIKSKLITDATATIDPLSHETLNKSVVTSPIAKTYNSEKATPTKPGDEGSSDVVINTRKGSVKGFLRKASRLIEKRTGIDPVNDNGQLLIGMVAVKLK